MNPQQQQQIPTEALILQVLQQLQQQQLVTNQLLQTHQETQEQQRVFMRQQGEALRNLQVQVPTGPEAILDSLAGNIKEFRYDVESGGTFAAWFSRYDDLFARDAARLDEAAKVRLLMRKLGTAEHERFVSFIMPKAPKDFTFEETVTKLKSLFGAAESVISKRYRCLQISKGPTEDYISYACRVNKCCVEFELGKLSEEEFKSLVFVCGLKSETDADVRARLLTRIEERKDVTLEQLSTECQRLLNLRHDAAMIEGSGSSVNAIKRQQRFQMRSSSKQGSSPKSQFSSSTAKRPSGPCWNCGGAHYSRDCSFKSHQCSDCNRYGHKEGYCASSKKPAPHRQFKRKSQNITVETKTVTVSVDVVRGRRRFVSVVLNGVFVRLQLDTASDISVISVDTWKRLGKPCVRPPSVKARAASGDKLKLVSEFDCPVTVNGVTQVGTIFVVDRDLHILGLDLIESFQLDAVPISALCSKVTGSSTIVERLKAEYPEVFSTALGKCTKATVKLELKPDQQPVFRPKRPVAYSVYQAVDDELDRLERMQIITPVDYSEWAAPIVVVRKANGNIRICGDYSTGLNDALQPNQYPLPLPQDIFVKFANCKIFSIVDMSDSYLQLEVDEVSSKLLAINTHRGIYKVNRLAPGVKAAPGAFQQVVDAMLAGLKHTCGYIDDIIVGGRNEEEHRQNLEALFKRLQEFGFTVRLEKCSFGKPQIKYLGHLLDQHGVQPDPAKVEAIRQMPEPVDVSGVRAFLGAVNFYGKFVPNMRAIRYPLDQLLKAGTKFEWTAECQSAFDKFKEILTSDLLLTHYNPALEIIVSADASSIGLGATISHRFPDGSIKVVQHASRALTPAERNYSQPDREGLAIIFAVTKFHRMVFGRKFRLQTDHAPLLRIFGSKKGIPVYTANRLQRWALMLLMYDFTIEYVATEKFGQVDVLSRLINQHAKPDEDYVIAAVSLEDDVRSVAFDSFNVLPLNFSDVQKGTQKDSVLSKVYHSVQQGWTKVPPATADRELQKFYNRRESLTTVQGCILFSDRLVVPRQLRKRCLDQLHQGHPGIQRMKAIARSYVYWPSIDVEIAEYVKACPHCARVAKSPAQAMPVPWPKSQRPWQRVHVDYAGPLDGEYYLLVVDSFSKWPEIVQTSRITAIATIKILRSLFARLGMPETVVSDNGTQFTSAEFAEFCSTNGIQHITTAPFHPQSNGQAERFVDTFKRATKKIREGKGSMQEALDLFLLTYRTTPNPSAPNGSSPSEAMFGRRIRTNLELLRPPTPCQQDQEQQPGKHRSFNRNDLVYVKIYSRNAWSWVPGTVVEKLGQVMYNVWADDRRLVRSHVNQLRGRSTSSPDRKLEASATVKTNTLPLDVLLEEWGFQEPSQPIPSPSTPSPENSPKSSSASKIPSLSPSVEEISRPEVLPNLSTQSSSTVSSNIGSALSSTPVVHQPRRSSRIRRMPARFNVYHRF